MKKLTILTLLLISLIGCVTTTQIAQPEQKVAEKIVLSNYINEIKILGDAIFYDQERNLSITVKPIDARIFDQEISSGNYYGGEHRSVLTTKNIVRSSDFESNQNEYVVLSDKLLDEGLSFADIRTITEIIDGKLDAPEDQFIFTNPDIQTDNVLGVHEANPFAIDGRYLTIVELNISNRSSIPQYLCEDNFLITSSNNPYSNIHSYRLLDDISASSLRYELLHKLLMKDCLTVPANSNLKTHLVYPSFYDKNEMVVHYINGEVALKQDFQIENVSSRNHYYFSKIKVTSPRNRGYRIVVDSSSRGFRILDDSNLEVQSDTHSTNYTEYHFVKIGNSIAYVGFKDFFIHDEIDFQTVEIFTVKFQNNENVDIQKTPVTTQAIANGIISIED